MGLAIHDVLLVRLHQDVEDNIDNIYLTALKKLKNKQQNFRNLLVV